MELQGRAKANGSSRPSREVTEEKDVFKEVPLRYMGYANEVGEAFRHLVPVRAVHFSYVLASSYVASHAASQGYKASINPNKEIHTQPPSHVKERTPVQDSTALNRQQQCLPRNLRPISARVATLETLIWQGFASVIIPGITINRLCALSRLLLNRYTVNLLSQHIRGWTVTGIGLGSIPFIIHPIDRAVDKCMDWQIRPRLVKYLG